MPSADVLAPILSVEHVRVQFGGLVVLNDLSFHVSEGEILGLIGPNGAGKSTVVNAISGFTPVSSGTLEFSGNSLRRLSPAQRSRRGIARTFQNLELFDSMSVFNNVLCGAEVVPSPLSLFSPARRRARIDSVREVLTTLGLESIAGSTVATLPYGMKKLVELARVFVRQPRFVLLDEPVAGLTGSEKEEFVDLFTELIDRYSLSGILIEHDMPTVRSVCSRLVVLDAGRLLAEGAVEQTLRQREVVEAYLGPLALSGSDLDINGAR